MATQFDRQVVLELLMTPTAFTMEFVGIMSAGLAGLDAIGPWGYLVGLAGILGGFGWGISRVILNPEKVVEEMLQKKRDKSQKQKKVELDAFEKELTDTKDYDVRRPFRELRTIYTEFMRQCPTIVESMRDEMERDFSQLFEKNLASLRNAHANLLTVRGMESERLKKPFVNRRINSLESVKRSMDLLVDFVNGLSEATDIQDDSAMAGWQDSLKSNLEIMKEVVQEETQFLASRTYE